MNFVTLMDSNHLLKEKKSM